jgi:hypothetical protein
VLAHIMTASYTVTVECGGGNEYDGRLGLRISSIFVIGAGSLLGMSAIICLRYCMLSTC